MSDCIRAMNAHRDFPDGTCPASRHAAIIAERLVRDGKYPMIDEEHDYVGETIAAVVKSLWQARAALHRLGYICVADKRGTLRWRKAAAAELADEDPE